DHGVARLVHTSTSEVYGTARSAPMTEDHPLQAQSPYAASKIAADKLVESFHLSFGVPAVTLRPFNTFGPRQSARAVIPAVAVQAISGPVVKLGAVHPTRDFVFVDDTADAFLRAAAVPGIEGRTLHFGGGREVSIGDVARMIGRAAGRDIEIVTDQQRLRPEGSEVDRLIADAAQARQALGWTPRVSLEEGLERTVAFIRDHLHLYRPQDYAT